MKKTINQILLALAMAGPKKLFKKKEYNVILLETVGKHFHKELNKLIGMGWTPKWETFTSNNFLNPGRVETITSILLTKRK